jgi:acetyltransferase-like isoleucine patch superfamily enzyme
VVAAKTAAEKDFDTTAHRIRRVLRRLASAIRKAKLRLSYGRAVSFGRGCYLGPGFILRLEPGGRLHVGDRVHFRQGCTLEIGGDAELTIGDDTVMTFGVVVQCARTVTIGSGCMFANGASVVDSRHELHSPRTGKAETPLETWPVEIGDGVWISSKSTVGASIGFGSVIGAHSFVSKPIPPLVLAFGVPATPRNELAASGTPDDCDLPPERELAPVGG